MRLLTLLVGVPGWLKNMLTQEDRRALGGADLRIHSFAGDIVRYDAPRLGAMLDEAVAWVEERQPDEEFGMFLAYALAVDGSEVRLRQSFFPSCAAAGLPVVGAQSSGNRARASKNQFVREAVQLRATHLARAKVMREHLTSNARTTPLLLPLEKFQGSSLAETLDRLSVAGGDGDRLAKSIKVVRKFLERRLATQAHSNARYFTAMDLVFVPPGNQSEAPTHAFARTGDGHRQLCLLAGRLRLGAAFNPRFHYDCQPLTGNVATSYVSCHGQKEAPARHEYVNIAPNDFIR